MGREPSIHVTEDQLRKILKKYVKLSDEEFEKVPKLISVEARKVSCDNRIVLITNQKIDRDIKKLLVSNKGDTNLMSTILYSIRKSMKHKGIQRIKEGTANWKQVKELSELALEFCNDFELDKREGFIIYIRMGLKRMSSQRNIITKLIRMYEVISLMYEAQLIVDSDKNKEESEYIHRVYVGIVSKKTGITDRYDNDPINYVHFIRVREITDKYNVSINLYLEAQFEGLEWTEGYPTPVQLTSNKAIDRLNKYMFKHKLKIKIESETTESKRVSKLLKKIKDGNYLD